MRATRLVAPLAVLIFGLAVTPAWTADDSSSQPPATVPAASAPAATPEAPKSDAQTTTPGGAQGAAPSSAPAPGPAPAPQSTPAPHPAPAPATSASPKKEEPPPPASVTILGAKEAHGVLGRDVRSAANEDMGHIVDVIVDRTGTVRAAVIDFGGFLGVGSRKIVVDWNALRFGRVSDKSDAVTLELTKDQVKAAPEYKEDQPIVVLGASGSLKPLEFDDQ
ncbi:MAG TPA: PRC-barrel domain-containing protein [Bradyrhizobium sp.]|nr:PRC-barrel domain-containing protein [Bradyrhizobium sp.]